MGSSTDSLLPPPDSLSSTVRCPRGPSSRKAMSSAYSVVNPRRVTSTSATVPMPATGSVDG